jgi:hypothetical protein
MDQTLKGEISMTHIFKDLVVFEASSTNVHHTTQVSNIREETSLNIIKLRTRART